ncbi:MAG: hypothetical protein KDA25_11740 [Phycisphaerales bacterium]|nr:hypothetical protein [Phycisphaerales bacterium]
MTSAPGAERVVVTAVPHLRIPLPAPAIIVMVLVTGLGVAIAFFMAGTRFITWLVLTMVVTILVMQWIRRVVMRARRARSRPEQPDPRAEAYERVLADVNRATPRLAGRRWGSAWWRRYDEARQGAGLEPVRAYVDYSALEVASVPVREELLEAETIPSSIRISAWRFVVTGVIAAAMVWGAYRFRSPWLVAGAAIWALIAVRRALGARSKRLRVMGRPAIAWPGVLEDAGGRRWTVDDSIALVTGLAHGGLIVYVIGAAGFTHLLFSGVEDPAFVDFWQRWTHPHPRVSLDPLAPSDAPPV